MGVAPKDRKLFGMAGLWESWNDPVARQPLETFTIITTDPNEVMEPIHTRMPVILRPEDYERWPAPVDPAIGHPQTFSGPSWCLWRLGR
jgi:putative SOS response-associated peptidase YedK